MKKDIKYKCPLCGGSGKIISHRTLYDDKTRKKARKLYARGLSLRAIGKKMNINHPQKVYSLIMAKHL